MDKNFKHPKALVDLYQSSSNWNYDLKEMKYCKLNHSMVGMIQDAIKYEKSRIVRIIDVQY